MDEDRELLAQLKKAQRRAESQWNMGVAAQIERRIEEVQERINNSKVRGLSS